jgi:hypothetical protein
MPSKWTVLELIGGLHTACHTFININASISWMSVPISEDNKAKCRTSVAK